MSPEIQNIMGRIFWAGTISISLSLVIYPFYIKYLKRKAFGQQIREDGPEHHYAKKDTPTMGGLALVLISLISAGLFLGKYMSLNYYILVAVVIATMAIGVLDDYSKIAKGQSLGLRAREKLILQVVIGCGLAFYILNFTGIKTEIKLPFGLPEIDSNFLFWIFTVFVITGTINAVNLTDGLDGLAAGVSAVGFLAYMVICYKNAQYDLAVASFAFCCACVGFLWFNAYPAKIFMGDTGSLSLGAALGVFAILSRTEFLLIIIGGIFVAEALSVILQVSYFKTTKGKRLFKMSPLHHHFEKCGWHEVEVTVRFWIVTLMLAVLGLILYFRDFLPLDRFPGLEY